MKVPSLQICCPISKNSENELQSKLQSEQTYLLTNKKRNDQKFSQSELNRLTNEVLDREEFLYEFEQVDISDNTYLGQINADVEKYIETLHVKNV